MCIKINLKQTVLARLFFFVIYDVKIPFMHLTWGEEGLTLLSLSVSFLRGLRRFLWEIQTCSVTFRGFMVTRNQHWSRAGVVKLEDNFKNLGIHICCLSWRAPPSAQEDSHTSLFVHQRKTPDQMSVNDAILQVEPLMASAGTCNQTPHTLLSLF